MSTKYLDAAHIISTIERLKKRIGQRFPDSGLQGVCGQLEHLARQTTERARWISQPIWSVRIATWVIVLAMVLIAVITLFVTRFPQEEEPMSFSTFIQTLESGFQDLVFIGAMFFFLFTLEIRIKRRRALKAIHELRAIAHIIDMHQLTKDPERVVSRVYVTTEMSPKPELTRFQLRRYLDYCSEMLSLTGKLAALYVQDFDDSVALSSVNEVESLTTGLSRKIWQKIMILHGANGDEPK